MTRHPQDTPPQGGPTFRRARISDLSALRRLETACFPDPWSPAAIAAELSQPMALTWLAEEEGQVIGFASFRLIVDEAELLRLAVALAARGRGLGRRLVEHGLARVREAGASRCFLEVREDNAPAQQVYRQAGFEPSGRRSGYYGDGADALVFSRSLP